MPEQKLLLFACFRKKIVPIEEAKVNFTSYKFAISKSAIR